MRTLPLALVLLMVSVAKIHCEDVNKNLPLYCRYVQDDVTHMLCINTGVEVYNVLKQLQELGEEERSRVTWFQLKRIDMPALRARAFAMFPNLKKLEVTSGRTYACSSEAFQGIPQLETLNFNVGTGTTYQLDGLFDNLNLTSAKFGIDFYANDDLTQVMKGLKNYKFESIDISYWRMSWADLSNWLQGDHLKSLTLNTLNYLFDLSEKPIDKKEYFKMYTHLESLSLKSNRITFIVDGAFSFSKKLKSINLYGNWLHRITPGMFEGLDELTALDLSRNLITTVAVEDFGNMTSRLGRQLRVNMNRNSFECGCKLMENAYDFMNVSNQLVLQNFQCMSGNTPKRVNVLDLNVIESNLTTKCAPAVIQNCCHKNNNKTVVADWYFENLVEVFCKATGTPKPKVWCEPISGHPMPKDSIFYKETYALGSYAARWFHALKNESGTVRCSAMNSLATVSEECTIEVKNDWITSGGKSATSCRDGFIALALLLAARLTGQN
ncbi:uncharacterized protein LOC135484396 [Lineus longissimus]|uniref:uncharacterized protein LOC135484396 n=1 Tax=Lineus longissimus TaxID=88925 RepID=UPI00315DA13A